LSASSNDGSGDEGVKKEDPSIKIDWTKIDTGKDRHKYETKNEYFIIPYVIYHYIGPPVNKLFPSGDNLKSIPVEGVYFTGSNFFAIDDISEDQPETNIVFPFVGNIEEVTYSVKFCSKVCLRENKYFGSSFCSMMNTLHSIIS